MAYRDYIATLRTEFVGRNVVYQGRQYKVAMVDYNGIIHIDKPSEHNPTTAVYGESEARRALVD